MVIFEEDGDPFEELVRELLGNRNSKIRRGSYEEIIGNEEEERVIDFIEDEGHVYLIFELPGYDKKDVLISIKNQELEITVKKRGISDIQDYLMEKLNNSLFIKKRLPDFIKIKNYSYTLKNGVLEVVFIKK